MSSPNGNVERSRTILWCVPRAISSAFAKCLSFIDGSEVWFEPYTYSYAARKVCKEFAQIDFPMEYEGNEEIFQKAKGIIDMMSQSKIEADRLP